MKQEPFSGTFNWNGDDSNGQAVPTGAYMAIVSSSSGTLGTVRLVKL